MTNIPQLQFPVPRGVEQYEVYRRLSQVALRMQQRGIRVDREALERHRAAASKRLERFRGLWEQFTGVKELGVDGQTAQVKAWFWDTMQLPKVSLDKKTKKPKLDTNGALMHYLTEIEDERVNKAAAALIGFRKAAKALSMLVQYDKDRVYPSWNVTGTKGARWSCSGPNLQQLSSKTVKYDFGDGPEPVATSLKDIIVPDEGHIFIGADYSALELYLQTYLAGAKSLLQWIDADRDLHLANAQILFGKDRVPDTATKKTHKMEREVSKLLYGLAYCASDHVATTAKQMRAKDPALTERIVQEFRRRYFRFHPEFPAWQTDTIRRVDELGYVEIPPFSRRLYLEPSNRGHNQSLNAQPQNLGGDIVNIAMLALGAEMSTLQGYSMVIQCHDSLIIQVPNAPADIARGLEMLPRHMTAPLTVNGHTTKLAAEAVAGMNWDVV